MTILLNLLKLRVIFLDSTPSVFLYLGHKKSNILLKNMYFCKKLRIMVLELEDLFQKNGYSEKDFRLDMAILVYQRKVASLNRAARLAGVSLKAFEQILFDRNISKPANNTQSISLSEQFLNTLNSNDPLRDAIKPIKSTITIEELIKEQNYQGTDWNKLNAIAEKMAIQEPIEMLLAQLKD